MSKLSTISSRSKPFFVCDSGHVVHPNGETWQRGVRVQAAK